MKTSPAAQVPSALAFQLGFYAAAFAGLCLFFWFLGGKAVLRNDELQHIHAAVSASQGKLPYRDYFDNHVPAFQFLSAVEIRALRLRPSPDFPVTMRRLASPWLAAQLLLLVLLSRSVFESDKDHYLSAALLAGAMLPLMAAQARPEPIWGTLFFLSLYLFSSRPPSVKSFLLAGLVNGLNACVSLKTIAFPVLPELLSLPYLLVLYPAGLTAASSAALFGGLLVFPGLLVLYFYHAGAMADFVNLAVLYSLRGGSGGGGHILRSAAILLAAAGLSWFVVKVFSRRRAAFLVPVTFALGILALYPVREAQTLFPFRALFYTALAGLAVMLLRTAVRGAQARRAAVLVLLLGVIYGRLASENAFNDNNAGYRRALDVMLRLQPAMAGTVMDAKGESLFWQRPFFQVLETFGVQGIRAGTIKDSVPEDSLRAATPVVFIKYPDRFTPLDMAYFSANYLPVCGTPQVLAAGKELRGEAFDTLLPLDYELLCPAGPAAGGLLDGKKYSGGAVALSAGAHKFKAPPACGVPLLVWERAAGNGALPCGYGEKK